MHSARINSTNHTYLRQTITSATYLLVNTGLAVVWLFLFKDRGDWFWVALFVVSLVACLASSAKLGKLGRMTLVEPGDCTDPTHNHGPVNHVR